MAAFRPMLAHNKEPTIRFPMYASVKLDGLRCVINGGEVLSRTLKLIPNAATRKRFSHAALEGLDGELIVGPPNAKEVFERTTSGCMSHDGDPDAQFYVFDLFRHPEQPFHLRLKNLTALQTACGHPNVWLVNQVLVTSQEELDAMENSALEQGFEGLMLRSPDGLYKYGRSTDKEGWLLKLKRFADAEAVILEVVEQYENTNAAYKDETGRTKRSTAQDGLKPKGTAGALRVRGINGQFNGVEFQMPVGTAENAAKLWAERATVPGKIVKYGYFPVGSKDAPRFPTWKGLRAAEDVGEAP